MTASPPGPPDAHRRNRNALLLIALMIFGSFIVAGTLRFSGWRPAVTRNKGELLQPPGDLRRLHPQRGEGGEYAWNPIERHWRILVAPPSGCGTRCEQLASDLDKVRQLTGREADRVEVLWLGGLPAGVASDGHQRALQDSAALRAALPRAEDPAGGPVTYIVDPNGFAILRYPPGHDPADLRSDLSRLLKLR